MTDHRPRVPRPTQETAQAATDATLPTDRLIRWSTIAVVVAVAAGAGVVSYGHAYELVHAHGESGTAAWVVPATVDGLMYASGMVHLQAARYRIRAHWLAHVGLWGGILATIGANGAHGLGHGWIGALVSAWPAAALIVSYELLMKLIRAGDSRGDDTSDGHDKASGGQCRHPVAEDAEEAALIKVIHARDCLGEPATLTRVAAAFKVDRKKLGQLAAGRATPVESEREQEPQTEPAAHTVNGRAAAGATPGDSV